MLAGEDVAELARLLFEPRDRLRIGDLALPIGDLLFERGVLRRERSDLRVQVAALRDLSVHRERDQPANPRDEHDGNAAQRDGTVERGTWSGTDDAFLCLGAE